MGQKRIALSKKITSRTVFYRLCNTVWDGVFVGVNLGLALSDARRLGIQL
jgi:hypothetical protein